MPPKLTVAVKLNVPSELTTKLVAEVTKPPSKNDELGTTAPVNPSCFVVVLELAVTLKTSTAPGVKLEAAMVQVVVVEFAQNVVPSKSVTV